MLEFHSLPIWTNAVIFAVGAGIIWLSGFRLAIYGDAIAEQKNWGQAFVGALLLGVATSLPEIATTITASLIGNPNLAVNNLMGGVATQVAVLAVIDLVLVKGALTFFSAKPVLLLAGVLLVLQLALTVVAMIIGDMNLIWGLGFWPLLLLVVYILSMRFLYRYEGNERWAAVDIPDRVTEDFSEAQLMRKGLPASLKRLSLLFLGHAVVVLVAGWAVSSAGDAIAKQTGLGSSFIGATLVAVATSLPEISTTAGAVRVGAYTMAVANILGTNSLECGLLFIADLFYRQGPIIQTVDRSAQLAAVMGIVVTCLYLWGLIERRDKHIFGMGIDSFLVLVVWIAGWVALYQLR